ncbi:MAG TPA: hypothetical protein VE987_15465, partial [Polyangiaceae bacterium]|nr:hypothetical protein [Polyangiaceae bacterium]
MTRKPTPERNAAAGSSLADALDRLYAAPLERFVPLRRELAAALRAQGEAPASRLVASAGKPTRAAWALNQVVRDDPRRVVALFEAWDAAADAQARGDAAAMRATARAYRDRAGELTQAVRDRTAKAGAELGAAQLRQVGATLQAASAGGDDGRAKLLRARLTRHVELDDPFEGIPLEGAHAPAQPGAATGRSEARAQPAAHRAPGATAQARAESAERKRAQAAAERAALREREERRRRIEEI